MATVAEIQKGFIADRLPPIGKKVELLCTKDGELIELALLCAWSDSGWILAGTKRPIEHDVIGWRSPRSVSKKRLIVSRTNPHAFAEAKSELRGEMNAEARRRGAAGPELGVAL